MKEQANFKNGSVLIVDDSHEIVHLFSLIIQSRTGFEVVGLMKFSEVESNSRAVLATDAAIIDINLGPNEPNGLDVYEWLRRNNYQGKIAFLTGHALTHPLVSRANRFENVRVFNKPMASDALINFIEHSSKGDRI